MAEAIAAAGDHDGAETVARSITGSYQQAWALPAVAKALATGKPDRAETVARSTTDPDQQAWALTAVAGPIAGVGDRDRAGRLLAAALAVASWRVSLSVLAAHWPQVVLRYVDALSGNEHS